MQVLHRGQFVIHSLNSKGVEGEVEKKQAASFAHLASALEAGLGVEGRGRGSEDEEGRGRGRETEAESQSSEWRWWRGRAKINRQIDDR